MKDRVLVIGGGNVAVDVARTALRLGARNVEMVCLEQRHEMPAYKEEIEATLAENIKIRDGWGPKRILGNGSVTGIELKRCTRVFDEQKRFSPAFDENDSLQWRPTRSSSPSARWWTNRLSATSMSKRNAAVSRPTR